MKRLIADQIQPASNKTATQTLAVLACLTVFVLVFEEFGIQFGGSQQSTEISSTSRDLKASVDGDEALQLIREAEVASGIRSLHLLSAGETSSNNNRLQSCPAKPPNLVGQIRVKRLKDTPPWEELEETIGSTLAAGGRYQPKDCIARQKVAIIIPFRDRMDHLRILLTYLHPILQSQQLHYGVYVMEQIDEEPFNRAALLNVGFLEASKIESYNCFVFHDVDFIPITDQNLYKCMTEPVLLSAYGNRWRGRRPYRSFFGGVVAVSRAQMLRVNGYSNQYWGWGAEDDDMAERLKSAGYRLGRRKSKVGMYMTLYHKKADPSNQRWKLLNAWDHRMETDGLNTISYDIDNVNTTSKLYTKFGVRLNRKSTEEGIDNKRLNEKKQQEMTLVIRNGQKENRVRQKFRQAASFPPMSCDAKNTCVILYPTVA